MYIYIYICIIYMVIKTESTVIFKFKNVSTAVFLYIHTDIN